MQERRWYPTVTALRSGGRTLVTSGSKYSQLYVTFGKRGTTLAGDSLFRSNVTAGGGWETMIPLRVASGPEPALREGHTALDMTGFYALYLFFGGRNADGPRNDLYELRRDVTALGSE